MTSTDPGGKSADTIEREIEEERADLRRTAEALQERLSIGGLIDEVMERTRHGGGDFARNFGRTIRDNPVPVTLIGAGLAWLMISGRDDGRGGFASMTGHRSRHLPEGDPLDGVRRTPRGQADETRDERWRTEDETRSGFGSSPGLTSSQSQQSGRGVAGRAADTVSAAAGGVRDRARSAAERAGSGASAAGDAIGDAAGSAASAVRQGGRRAGEAVGDAASSAARAARRGGRRAGDSLERFVDEQPLVAGALALAAGAALGGLLPNSRLEDRYMGEHAQRLRDEAYDRGMTEADKARRVANAAADEARAVAAEKVERVDAETPDDGRRAVNRAESEVREAADRIAQRAGEEAERQDLGRPSRPGEG